MPVMFTAAAVAIVVLFTAVAMAGASKPGEAASSQDGGQVYVSNPTDKVVQFANAIGFAEGAWDRNLNPSTDHRAWRNNNPGDFLGSGDAGSDGAYARYTTMEKGKQRLYGQLQMIIDGTSEHYNLDQTISDMAYSWTATEQDAWSENVASFLGVTRDTPLRGLLT